MAKRIKRRSFLKRSYLLGGSLAILTLLTLFFGFWFYSLGFEDGKESLQSHTKSSLEAIKKKEQEVLKAILSEVEDYKENTASQAASSSSKSHSITTKVNKKHSQKAKHSHKPRLAIIIDDVAYRYQVNAIRSLHIPINLSFFPPSARHPFTPKYTRSFRHYMIHLPLEATRYKREEYDTLRVTSSYGEIERVIKKIRREFPKARYINNHTGSKFTADLQAVRRLVSVLDRYDFKFLDSRTTAQTKVPKVMRELGRPYLHRDIFLDNDPSIPAIKAQIKKAVELARKKGLAIAIGHPHKNTIEALRQSKRLLRQVRLIYIDQL